LACWETPLANALNVPDEEVQSWDEDPGTAPTGMEEQIAGSRSPFIERWDVIVTLQDSRSGTRLALMAEVSFFAAQLNQATPIGFSEGWAVIRRELGRQDQFASSPFSTEAEARAEIDRLMAQIAAKNA
jgi:hypothetical protein